MSEDIRIFLVSLGIQLLVEPTAQRLVIVAQNRMVWTSVRGHGLGLTLTGLQVTIVLVPSWRRDEHKTTWAWHGYLMIDVIKFSTYLLTVLSRYNGRASKPERSITDPFLGASHTIRSQLGDQNVGHTAYFSDTSIYCNGHVIRFWNVSYLIGVCHITAEVSVNHLLKP